MSSLDGRLEQCFEAIAGERDYQDRLWEGVDSGGKHPTVAYLTFIRVYLRQAEEIASLEPAESGDENVRRILRKIAAMCCNACENNGGMPPRETDPEDLSISRPGE